MSEQRTKEQKCTCDVSPWCPFHGFKVVPRADAQSSNQKVEHAEDIFDTGWAAGYESAQVDLAHMKRQADEIERLREEAAYWRDLWKKAANSVLALQGDVERLTRELESEKHYAATQQAEKEHWAGTADQQQDIIDRLSYIQSFGPHPCACVICEGAREALNIGQKIGQVATLELAREVIASAYQAVACLVLKEPDKRPSEADEIRLLDMLSCWEEWSAEEIESFLPWPKEWQPDKTAAETPGCEHCDNGLPVSETEGTKE